MRLPVSVICVLGLILGAASPAHAQKSSGLKNQARNAAPVRVVRDHRGATGKLQCMGRPCPPRGSEHKAQSAGVKASKVCVRVHRGHCHWK